jgi:hypothetical protein
VFASRAAFQGAAQSGCLGEIDGRQYLRALEEYERHVRHASGSPGSGGADPATLDASARGRAQTELDWIAAEKSWVLDCYGGIVPRRTS